MENWIIIKLKKDVINLRWKTLEKFIKDYIKSWNIKIICKWINRRPVYIDEYLLMTNSRKSWDKNHRKQCFFSAIELIKRVNKNNLTNFKEIDWKISYEFLWITPSWKKVWVHIVEFKDNKDKKLKLVSTFWDEKKA